MRRPKPVSNISEAEASHLGWLRHSSIPYSQFTALNALLRVYLSPIMKIKKKWSFRALLGDIFISLLIQ